MAHGFRDVPKDRKHAEPSGRRDDRVTYGTHVTPTPVIPLDAEPCACSGYDERCAKCGDGAGEIGYGCTCDMG